MTHFPRMSPRVFRLCRQLDNRELTHHKYATSDRQALQKLMWDGWVGHSPTLRGWPLYLTDAGKAWFKHALDLRQRARKDGGT